MLPTELLEKLLTHADPEVAGAAKQLKQLRDEGKYIPKEKFDEVNRNRQEQTTLVSELQAKLQRLESERTQQESETVRKLREEKDSLTQERDKLKPDADAYVKMRTDKIAFYREQFGDQWTDEYEKLSLPALERLHTNRKEFLHTDRSRANGNKPDGTPSKPLSEMTRGEREKVIADAKSGKYAKKGT